jgi:ribosomal protein S18 acetylase RimI-like enzyme
MSVAIRPAKPDDATAIARLHALTHRATYAPLIDGPYEAPSPSRRLAEWQAALAGSGLTLVAVEGDRIVGFGHAEGDRIEPLHVDPAYHRHGIGRALMRDLLDGLQARAIPSAIFNVFARNAKAIAFYEALGARRTGTETMTDAPVPYLDFVYEIETGLGSLRPASFHAPRKHAAPR